MCCSLPKSLDLLLFPRSRQALPLLRSNPEVHSQSCLDDCFASIDFIILTQSFCNCCSALNRLPLYHVGAPLNCNQYSVSSVLLHSHIYLYIDIRKFLPCLLFLLNKDSNTSRMQEPLYLFCSFELTVSRMISCLRSSRTKFTASSNINADRIPPSTFSSHNQFLFFIVLHHKQPAELSFLQIFLLTSPLRSKSVCSKFIPNSLQILSHCSHSQFLTMSYCKVLEILSVPWLR